jgi:AAA domain/UvrD-like helicase C-terminal domain
MSSLSAPALVLSADQEEALAKLKVWLKNKETYFVLKGFAGTGKTVLLKYLIPLHKNLYFSATTNKAAKVLSDTLGIKVKTVYSILGLRMEQVEDKLVLTETNENIYFPAKSVLAIDETSNIGTKLQDAIEAATHMHGLKILYIGDPAQLPPIGEVTSPAWGVTDKPENKVFLTDVMRYDDQLLTLATAIRECIKTKRWVSPVKDDNDGKKGVWLLESRRDFEELIGSLTAQIGSGDAKIVSWTNKTVAYYTRLVRENLGYSNVFDRGDRLMLMEPIERNKVIISHVDDEYIVENVSDDSLTVDGVRVATYRLEVIGEMSTNLQVCKDEVALSRILANKASIAKNSSGGARKKAWKDFWETNKIFHKVRYGYSLTAHRAQGSTYSTMLVDQFDILRNPVKKEAFQCLYVACTRASRQVYSY